MSNFETNLEGNKDNQGEEKQDELLKILEEQNR